MGSPREEQRRVRIHVKYNVSEETGTGVANAGFLPEENSGWI